MKELKLLGTVITVSLALSACSMFGGGKRGPIAQEQSQLNSDGEKMTAEGQKMIRDGRALQNSARESRIVAASQRKQADILTGQGKTDEATQLRLKADEQDANAAASDNKGREMEAQGLVRIGDGQDSQNRSDTLGKQGEQVESAR